MRTGAIHAGIPKYRGTFLSNTTKCVGLTFSQLLMFLCEPPSVYLLDLAEAHVFNKETQKRHNIARTSTQES